MAVSTYIWPLCQQDGSMSPVQTDLLIPWSTIPLGQEMAAMRFSHYNQSMKIAKSGIKELLSDTVSSSYLWWVCFFKMKTEILISSKRVKTKSAGGWRCVGQTQQVFASGVQCCTQSSPWTPGQGLPAFVQASAGSKSPEVILLQARFSGYRASSGWREMSILYFAEL